MRLTKSEMLSVSHLNIEARNDDPARARSRSLGSRNPSAGISALVKMDFNLVAAIGVLNNYGYLCSGKRHSIQTVYAVTLALSIGFCWFWTILHIHTCAI